MQLVYLIQLCFLIKVKNGYGLTNGNDLPVTRMDSFVLAETFKYLYLLFTDKEDLTLDIHKFLFTTEAHLLPLHLSTVSVNETATQVSIIFTRLLYPLVVCVSNELNTFTNLQ